MGANLKEVRERIKSVQSTQQITKAMKLVSASKLRRAQEAIIQMRPYANKLNEMLVNILSNVDNAATEFGDEREVNRALLVVITSSRGLCGAFNTNIIKAAVELLETKYKDNFANGTLEIMPIGKKAAEYFAKHYPKLTILDSNISLFDDLSFENISLVASGIMNSFKNNYYDSVDVAYGRFKNAAMQFPEVEEFLPVPKLESEGEDTSKADYIFEPTESEVLDHLVPSILQVQFQKYILDTHASEHGARMTAMDKATENADELMKELRITYNKARQEAITNEISEIVGGAIALEG